MMIKIIMHNQHFVQPCLLCQPSFETCLIRVFISNPWPKTTLINCQVWKKRHTVRAPVSTELELNSAQNNTQSWGNNSNIIPCWFQHQYFYALNFLQHFHVEGLFIFTGKKMMLGCLSTSSLFKIEAYSFLDSHWFFNDKSPNNKGVEIQRETFTGSGTVKCQCTLGARF